MCEPVARTTRHETPGKIRFASMAGGEETASPLLASEPVQAELEALRQMAGQPVVVENPVEESYTVTSEITECVPVVERYGLCGRRYRIVYRQVTRQVPEQKTRTKVVKEATPSIAGLPEDERSESSETFLLNAPGSAGAIAEEVEAVTDAAEEPVEAEAAPEVELEPEPEPEPEVAIQWYAGGEEGDELDELEDDRDRKKRQRKKRQLVYDEDLGEVVARRRRKPGRARDEWEEYLD